MCSTGFCVLRARDTLDPTYLFLFVQSPRFVRALSELVKGALYPAVTDKQVRAQCIPFPPLSTQRRVAARLTEQLGSLERARRAAQARHEAAKALSLSFVVREFGNDRAKTWPRRQLKCLTIGTGQYGTSQKSYPVQEEGAIPVLGIGNIKGGQVVWDRLKFTVLTAEDREKYRLRAGDLLFCRTNSADLVGETAVFDGTRESAFASYLVRFRLNPDLADPRFVSAYMNSPWGRHFIQQNLSRAIGQANVSASVVANMELPAPPVQVQRTVMERLQVAATQARDLSVRVEKEGESLERMPAALLRAAFNGDT